MSQITKLVLGERIEKENLPTETYQLDIEFMHGDADHYTTETLMFPLNDEDSLLEAINFFNTCINMYPHGRGGRDDYYGKGIKDYDNWCDNLHNDITNEGTQASVEAIHVFFWTDDSEQYKVVLK